MTRFSVGDEIYCTDYPEEIYTVTNVDSMAGWIPTYTIVDSYGKKFESHCSKWEKVIIPEEVLNKGELLIYDSFNENHPWDSNVFTEISIVKYDNRIFYVKQVDYEVVEFKELTK